ncbi:SusC/RagA family TonB-linked outer membrane protein [Winogradskyella sp. 3972H.M.0a.05]|uniref:SusC/RagA family TonB-linked outer membrane protein n=1 Tax=Winogradskyella sp. 3972H.M.0a.05 TaxID=2950277 RepID=UPI0033975BBA
MKVKNYGLVLVLLFFSVALGFAQERTITGTVTQAVDGLPLPGANVIVKGTTRGVQTDFDGQYSISVQSGETLVFSYVGLLSVERVVGASSVIDVSMQADNQLDEVVVVAYGTTSLKSNSASVTQLSATEVEDRANASVLQNLQGQVAGLNVLTGTGQPGADSTIILRGIGSINGEIEPLFVVDGIFVDRDNFRSINPNDIATFTVLKDGAAAGIYGNRGANGAVIITTKKGKFNEGLKFQYSTQFGYNELQDANLELMNSRQILELERTYNVALGAGLTDAEIAAISGQTNTYWTDVFFRRGTTMSHDLSMTSGSENFSNFSSVGYTEQDGIFLNSNIKRFNIRNNFNGRTDNGKLDYALNLSVGFSKTNEIDGAGSNAIFFAPFTAALSGLPYLSILNPDGTQTIDGGIAPGDIAAITANQNAAVPYILLNSVALNTDREEEVKLLGSFSANYNFAKNLTAGITLGADFSSEKRLEILHPESILGPFQANGTNQTQFGGQQQEDYTRDFRFNSVAKVNYNNTFANKHLVDVTAFVEYNKRHADNLGFTQGGLDPRILGTGSAFIAGNTTEDLNGNGTIDGAGELPYIPTIRATTVEEGLFSVFGKLDYEYDGKYGFSGTLRRDNSFRFIEDNAWGTFWSVSGRWNIDQEDFMQNTAFSLLKLRASYGVNGNQDVGGNSLTRTLFGSGGGYNGTVGTFIAQPANTDLRWEETKQTNFGLDFGVWNNRLSGSIDVYKKTTDGLFDSRQLSAISGFGALSVNTGTMDNEGAEVSLRYVVYDKNDWQISVNANGSYNKNTVNEVASSTGQNFLGGSTIIAEGHPVNSFYVVPYAGVNPANGNPLFVSADGSLSETFSDADRRFTDKTSFPVWQGGFGTDVRYKGFEFTTQWSFVADIWLNNLDLAQLEETQLVGDGTNRVTSVFRAWQNVGDVTDIPRVGNPFNAISYINAVDRYLEDASYLRLRNVRVGYTLPQKIMEKLPISSLRFFVQGENLVTFTSFRGWDAENGFRTTNRGQFPTPKILTFGTTINF